MEILMVLTHMLNMVKHNINKVDMVLMDFLHHHKTHMKV